ncbi:DUF1656 domain-containing protein [Acinetobacter sp. WZC-1]|uniref:DUF1656 domain-containing protein n=1 Tax=Acinetobacter sp. WZC-1 TaxID=3459034 RepID=UPI00403D8A2D
MGELNIYGVYVPILLVQAILAYALLRLSAVVTDKFIIDGWIAMPAVFSLGLYLILLWLMHGLFIWWMN